MCWIFCTFAQNLGIIHFLVSQKGKMALRFHPVGEAGAPFL